MQVQKLNHLIVLLKQSSTNLKGVILVGVPGDVPYVKVEDTLQRWEVEKREPVVHVVVLANANHVEELAKHIKISF